MIDFRQKLEQSRTKAVSGDIPADAEERNEYPYFAIERGRTPVCLELRLSEGIRKAVPYSYVMEMTYHADKGIEIVTTQKRIHITGRNLSRLFDYLVAYRVKYVESNLAIESEDGLFVKEITIEPLVLV